MSSTAATSTSTAVATTDSTASASQTMTVGVSTSSSGSDSVTVAATSQAVAAVFSSASQSSSNASGSLSQLGATGATQSQSLSLSLGASASSSTATASTISSSSQANADERPVTLDDLTPQEIRALNKIVKRDDRVKEGGFCSVRCYLETVSSLIGKEWPFEIGDRLPIMTRSDVLYLLTANNIKHPSPYFHQYCLDLIVGEVSGPIYFLLERMGKAALDYEASLATQRKVLKDYKGLPTIPLDSFQPDDGFWQGFADTTDAWGMPELSQLALQKLEHHGKSQSTSSTDTKENKRS